MIVSIRVHMKTPYNSEETAGGHQIKNCIVLKKREEENDEFENNHLL